MRRFVKIAVCVVALATPAGAQAQSVADFYKGKNVTIIVGYTAGGGSDPDTYAAFVRNVFGAKLKLVTGYHGTSDIILAIERGEVDGRCGWSWSSVKSTRPAWIPEKKLNYLVHMSEAKAPELAHI